MKFLALYLSSAGRTVKSISRPGRTSAYSPARRTTMTTTKAANTGASASQTKPAAITNGTATSSTPTPIRRARRPVRNTWVRIAKAWTTVSIRPNTWVCRVRSVKVSLTMRACSKYRNVLTLASSTTNSAIPSR
ncbi:hypothetical protein D3C79_899100 [compost metagenome]